MKLLNNGNETIMVFDGSDVVIPTGEFEVEDNVGNFIIRKSISLGLGIRSFSPELEVQKEVEEKEVEEPVEPEELEEEELEEEPIEEPEAPKKPKKITKKVVKKVTKKK